MSEEHNVQVLREAYGYWSDNKEDSFDKWMNMIDEAVQWRSIADGVTGMEFTRSCNCKDDVLRYFQELAAEWEMVHYTVDEFIAQGDRVVMIGSCGWKNRRTGRVIDTPKADIIRMRDSRIVEFYEFYDTAKAIAGAQ